MISHAQNDEPRTFTRRRIVRTAATAAWAVPAIQLATAVPAFAASGCSTAAVGGTAQWRVGGLNYIDIALDLGNGCNTALSGLTVTLTVCGLEDITYSGSEYLPAGWAQAVKGNKPLTANGEGCYTLTFMTAQTLDGNSATHPQFTVKTQAYTGSGDNRPAGTITAVVSSGGYTSPATVIGIPQVA